jgi:hypothetical protein
LKAPGIAGGSLPVARYPDRTGDGSYLPLLINSIDFTKMLALIGADKTEECRRRRGAGGKSPLRPSMAYSGHLIDTL